MNKTQLALTGLSALMLAACGDKTDPAKDGSRTDAGANHGATLDQVLAGDHRAAEERARDQYRHPKETLQFFGVKPDMTVVEIWPGGGWYSQVLAPYLASGGGTLYAAGLSPTGASERVTAALSDYRTMFIGKPDLYGNVEMTVLGEGEQIAPPGSADAVLTFRNVHNWQMHGGAEAVFQEFFTALKPGGVLGVVEHRADGADLPHDGTSGYVYTDDVIVLAQAAGFELDSASEINANLKDTKDHPFGVWTLPPSRRTSEVRGLEDPDFDSAKYEAIGESDRMTLKFRKPLAADGALLE